ncbi:MAG: methylglyoxal synthase [Saprospiraceae bacterium]|nr:methylglyoxal synthase [Saprospiraceae bacterium]
MKIALIAHDGKKADLVSFVLQNRELFQHSELFTTATTGRHMEQAGLTVNKVLSGPQGGDAQIAAMVATRQLDVVIFFRDPLDKHPHEPDVQMLMRICDVHNVPLATNLAAAKLILKGLKFDAQKK